MSEGWGLLGVITPTPRLVALPAAAFPRPGGQPGLAWHAHLGQGATFMSLCRQQWQLVKVDIQDTLGQRGPELSSCCLQGTPEDVSPHTGDDADSPQVLGVLLGTHTHWAVGFLFVFLEERGGRDTKWHPIEVCPCGDPGREKCPRSWWS